MMTLARNNGSKATSFRAGGEITYFDFSYERKTKAACLLARSMG
jgi:hypothetical protein